jgi:hypothetical protein
MGILDALLSSDPRTSRIRQGILQQIGPMAGRRPVAPTFGEIAAGVVAGKRQGEREFLQEEISKFKYVPMDNGQIGKINLMDGSIEMVGTAEVETPKAFSPITLQNPKNKRQQITLDKNADQDKIRQYTASGWVVREQKTMPELMGQISPWLDYGPDQTGLETEKVSPDIIGTEEEVSEIEPRGAVTGAQIDKALKISQQGDKSMRAGVEARNLIENDPSIAGLLGTAQRVGKDIVGGLEQLEQLPIIPNFVPDKWSKALSKESISQLINLENQLAVGLAEIRAYKGDRTVTKQMINMAKDELNLTGFTSPDAVIDRLNMAIKEIDAGTKHARSRSYLKPKDYSSFLETRGDKSVMDEIDMQVGTLIKNDATGEVRTWSGSEWVTIVEGQ